MGPFATDVLVEILRRLPDNCRRRSRLVCRRWRDLVDRRTTTNLRSRAKTLLVAAGGTALLLGDNVGRKPKKVLAIAKGRTVSVIGSCNGLICLCDDDKSPGAIALANPATGERLVLPPLPCADIIARFNPEWHRAYGFAHHQATGRYTVVHVPCRFNRVYEFDTVQVFTLGEAAWRDVPTPKLRGAVPRCRFYTGLVGVDGAVYWVAEGTDMIMCFDLGEERVTPVAPPPTEAMQVEARGGDRHLVEVRGRLGMAIFYGLSKGAARVSKTDVWVLESARGEQTWALQYSIEITQVKDWWSRTNLQLVLPHFTHGELVLYANDGDLVVYAARPSPDGVLQVGEQDVGNVIGRKYCVHQAFAHVETKEPLSIYRLW